MNMWEVILPAEEGKLEVSFRWFRTCKDAEAFCLKTPLMNLTGLRPLLGSQDKDGELRD